MPMQIVRTPIDRARLAELASASFGDMLKAVVDCERGVMLLGGDLHADGEQMLLDDGSRQENLWGINIYPAEDPEHWLEFDSMINVRPGQGNRSRSVDSPEVRAQIRHIVEGLIRP